ncbi:MAG: hypothetical protein JXQ73_19545 [Phycisphaerae bacterium]|nr:hypothetical protein [Phycisphaerae bacterium]
MPLIDESTLATPTDGATGYARFRIGEFDVALRSELDEVVEDFAALYGQNRDAYRRTGETIRIEVRRGKRSLLAGRQYAIWGDGEQLWATRRRNEVLPYVEWGINWRVIKTRAEYLQVHAATLSHKGQGMLFAAKAGSGKSTLAAGLLARGWQYLSDEFALIHPETLRVHPFPKPVCVKAGSFEVVEALRLPLWRRRHYVKVLKGRVGYVSPHHIGPDSVGGPCRVRHIIFPLYAEGTEPCLREIPRAEAAFELAEMAFNRNAFGPRAMTILSDLVRGAKCYRLDAGSIHETCDLIESLVRQDVCSS